MITRRLHAQVDHVWSKDPALDKDAADFKKRWTEFLDKGDVSTLPVVTGGRLTVWRLAGLKRWQKLQLSDTSTDKLLQSLRSTGAAIDGLMGLSFLRGTDQLVTFGLRGVTNLVDEEGRAYELEHIDDGHKGKILSAACLEQLHELGTHLMNELGFRILEVSEPSPLSERA